jgi:ribonucleoside-diphosphate reductase beta chain
MSLFKERIPYKPFEYPIYYTEGWLKQAQAFWLHTEIPMSGDVKDWNEKLTDAEKNLVGNILLGFAQTECAVSDYWTQKVVSWFPKHEVQQMAMMFGSQETIHAVAYSYLNETLGLEDFEAFLHEPATSDLRRQNVLTTWLLMTGMILWASVVAWQSFPLSQRVLVYTVLLLFYILFNYVIYSKE